MITNFIFAFLGALALALYGVFLLWKKVNERPRFLPLFDLLLVTFLCFLALENGWFFLGLLLPLFLLKSVLLPISGKKDWFLRIFELLFPFALILLGFGFLVRQMSMIISFGGESEILFALADGRWFAVLIAIVIGALTTFLLPRTKLISVFVTALTLGGIMSLNGALGALMGEMICEQYQRKNKMAMIAALGTSVLLFIFSDFYLWMIDAAAASFGYQGRNLFNTGVRLTVGYVLLWLFTQVAIKIYLKFKKAQ